MPDTEISRLTELPVALLQDQDALAIVDVSASETKKIQAVNLVQAGVDKLPDGSISTGKIDWDGGVTDVIDGSALVNRSVDGIKLKTNTVTASEIAPNAIGSSELADAAVDTAAIADNAVTNSKIANGISGSKLISDSVGSGQIAPNAIGSSELSDLSVDTAAIQNSAVTEAKLVADLNGDNILANGSVSSALAANSVGAAELADNSVATDAIQDGAISNDKLSSNIDGGKLNNGSVSATALDPTSFSDGIVLDGTIKINNSITAGTRSGISFNAQGLITSTAPLDSGSLPIATATSVGGVSVPAAGGLGVTNLGVVSIDNTITASTTSGISFNTHGLITATQPLSGGDLPAATSTTLGAVIVPGGTDPLQVDGSGSLTHSASGVAAGNYVNVGVNTYGLVISGSETLNANQVPSLDAGKITTGTFGTTQIADDAITMQKLADYSVSFIQEAEPGNDAGIHIGMGWFQESTGQLRMWNGNSWFPVGFGRLAQDNLRFCGTVDADTGLITSLTDNGRTAGFTVGQAVPSATDALSGTYLVVDTAGSNISVVPATSFDEGDWVLCIDLAGGWVRIDTLSGGGGGGALIRLGDLLDVDLNSPQAGDTLIYDPSTNNWTNRTTSAERVTLSPAFDGSTTAFTTSMDILDQNNMLLSLGGVLLEPGIDFTIASGTRDLSFRTPPPEGSSYWAVNQQTVNAGGGGGGGTSLPPGTTANEYLQWNNALGSWGPASEIDGGSF